MKSLKLMILGHAYQINKDLKLHASNSLNEKINFKCWYMDVFIQILVNQLGIENGAIPI
jgi:hypothetical protein